MNGTTKVTKDTKGWDLFKLTFVLFVTFVVAKHFLKCRFSFAKFLYNRRPYLVAPSEEQIVQIKPGAKILTEKNGRACFYFHP